jgi:peptide/nickel transport system substrate-binding protein/oligopeptide transport system substrate-binding protein
VTFEGKVKAAIGVVPPALPAGDLTAPPRDQAAEVAAARKLLAESRYGANLPRARLYITGGLGGMLREIYQQDLGVTIDVIAVTWNDFLQGLERREYAAYVLSWLADYPDPQTFVETLFRGDSPENHTNYSNPRLDALLDEAARATDPARRADLYRQAQRLLLDDAVVLPLYFATDYVLVKPYVKNLTITPMGIMGLERVWIER